MPLPHGPMGCQNHGRAWTVLFLPARIPLWRLGLSCELSRSAMLKLYHASPAQSFSSPACASFIERFSRRATAVIFGYKHLGITTATSVCWGRVSRPCCKRLQAASQLPPRTNDLQSIQCDGGTGRFLNQPFARLNFPRQPFAREFCMVSF